MAVAEHRQRRQAHEILDSKMDPENPETYVVNGKIVSAPLKIHVSESNLHVKAILHFMCLLKPTKMPQILSNPICTKEAAQKIWNGIRIYTDQYNQDIVNHEVSWHIQNG